MQEHDTTRCSLLGSYDFLPCACVDDEITQVTDTPGPQVKMSLSDESAQMTRRRHMDLVNQYGHGTSVAVGYIISVRSSTWTQLISLKKKKMITHISVVFVVSGPIGS